MQVEFKMPAHVTNYDGQERRVGFEFEYTGLPLVEMATLIQSIFGGRINAENEFSYKIEDTSFGSFSVESDSSYLKQKKYEKILEMLSFESKTLKSIADRLSQQSDILVPFEVVTPPIPLSAFGQIEAFRIAAQQKLQEQPSAMATLAPCGFHINPETISREPGDILNTIRAFCMLYDHLLLAYDVSLTRRVWPYIAPYSKAYQQLIMQVEYRPDLSQLIDDYIHFNPSRNHALDLLPLFAWLDEARVFGHEELELKLIKKRPTYHYRLPNCDLQKAHWTVADQWNSWVEIENLADELALKYSGSVASSRREDSPELQL